MAESTLEVTVPQVALGQNVIYVGTKGHPKTAIVINTPDSVDEGTSLAVLDPGQLHLAVWTHSAGGFTPRANVPYEGLVKDNMEFQNDSGTPVGFWRLP